MSADATLCITYERVRVKRCPAQDGNISLLIIVLFVVVLVVVVEWRQCVYRCMLGLWSGSFIIFSNWLLDLAPQIQIQCCQTQCCRLRACGAGPGLNVCVWP